MKRTLKIELDVNITDQDIEDIIVTALEGGTGYWACLDNSRPEWEEAYETEEVTSIIATRFLLEGKTLYFSDAEGEDDEIWELTTDKLVKGIRLSVINGNTDMVDFSNSNLDVLNIDSSVADCIIQYALFDKVVFG